MPCKEQEYKYQIQRNLPVFGVQGEGHKNGQGIQPLANAFAGAEITN